MKKKTIAVIAVVAVVAAGGWYWYSRVKAGDGAGDGEKKTVVVEKSTLDLKVASTGRVTPNLDVEIKSKANGQVIKLPYDISDPVSSGTLVAELDPVDENRNVAQRQAALDAARARLNQAREQLLMAGNDLDTGTSNAIAALDSARVSQRDARARLRRAEELFAQKLVSAEDRDAARTSAAAADQTLRQAEVRAAETRNLPRTLELRRQDVLLQQSQVRQSEVELENAQQRLLETRIFAPMDGVVTSRPVQTGQIIASGISNVGGGTTILTISDLSRLFVNAAVDEAEIGKIAVGQKATITTDAFPGKKFRGRVVRISAKGNNKQDIVTFEVKIEVEGEGKERLKPEMTANVEVQSERKEDILALPNEAIQSRGQQFYVEVPGADETTTTRKNIKPGITDGLKTEIVEGLKEGDKVVVAGDVNTKWGRAGAGAARGGADTNRNVQRATRSVGGGGGGGRR